MSTRRAVAVAALVSLVACGFIWLGGRFEKRATRSAVRSLQGSRLGELLEEETLRELASLYGEAGVDVGSIPYDPTKETAPFVGEVPVEWTPWPGPKEEGELRVFLTGGSVAHGIGASSQDERLGAHVRTRLRTWGRENGRDVALFVYANPAWASTHERILIVNRLSELNPDLIVALSGANDVYWGSHGRDVLWFRTGAGDAIDHIVREAMGTGRAAGGAGATIDREGRVDPQEVARKLTKNATLSNWVLAEQGTQYLVALQPVLGVTQKPLSSREEALRDSHSLVRSGYLGDCYAALRVALERGPAQYVDLSTALDDAGPQTLFLDPLHLVDAGQEVLAGALAEAIVERLEDIR